MSRAGLVVAIAAHAGCESTTPAAGTCLVDEDCPADSYCEGNATSNGKSCVLAQVGTCRTIDYSIVGMACLDAQDCKAPIFYCSAVLNECALNVCLSTGNDRVVCNHGQCPDAGAAAGGVVVECAPGCHAGTRNDICRSCFCESCNAPDGGAGDGG
jgi:hypothetical protein